MSSPFSLSALLHVKWTTMPPELKHNLLFRDTNIAWREICKCLGLPHSISKFLPIRGHPDFTPDLDLQMYQLWETKGLRTFADLCDPISGSFLPFQEIITKYSLPSNHIFFLKQCYHFFYPPSKWISALDSNTPLLIVCCIRTPIPFLLFIKPFLIASQLSSLQLA